MAREVKEKEGRSRSSFIKVAFSDKKKRRIGSRKRSASEAATAPMPSLVSRESIRGVNDSLHRAFGDTLNMNNPVAAYPAVTFDGKMYVGKDSSTGGSIGNIGSRAWAGNIGVADLYKTHKGGTGATVSCPCDEIRGEM